MRGCGRMRNLRRRVSSTSTRVSLSLRRGGRWLRLPHDLPNDGGLHNVGSMLRGHSLLGCLHACIYTMMSWTGWHKGWQKPWRCDLLGWVLVANEGIAQRIMVTYFDAHRTIKQTVRQYHHIHACQWVCDVPSWLMRQRSIRMHSRGRIAYNSTGKLCPIHVSHLRYRVTKASEWFASRRSWTEWHRQRASLCDSAIGSWMSIWFL